MKPLPIMAAVFFLLLGGISSVRAGDFGWSLPINGVQLLSDGTTPIPEGTVFHLGVFAGTFVPNVGNQADWATNWRSAEFQYYNAANSAVSGLYAVETNAPPFNAGKQMYVWGHHQKADGSSEQWLGTAVGWQVPSDDGTQLPVNVDIDDASTLLLGSADSAAGTIQMAAVPEGDGIPLIYGETWRNQYFTDTEIADPLIGAWQADPDADGINNELEFAMGTNPLVAQTLGSMRIEPDVGGQLLSFPGSASAAVSIGMEESSTLQNPWQALATPTFNPGNSRWELLVPGSGDKNFFRTTVTPLTSP